MRISLGHHPNPQPLPTRTLRMIGTCAVGQPAASLPSLAGAVSTVVNPQLCGSWAIPGERYPLPSSGTAPEPWRFRWLRNRGVLERKGQSRGDVLRSRLGTLRSGTSLGPCPRPSRMRPTPAQQTYYAPSSFVGAVVALQAC